MMVTMKCERVCSASVGPPRDFEIVTVRGHHLSREREGLKRKKILGKTTGGLENEIDRIGDNWVRLACKKLRRRVLNTREG